MQANEPVPSTEETLPPDLAVIMSELSDLYGVQVEQPKLFKGEFDVNVRFVDPTHGMLLAKVSPGSLGEGMLRWQEAVLRGCGGESGGDVPDPENPAGTRRARARAHRRRASCGWSRGFPGGCGTRIREPAVPGPSCCIRSDRPRHD